jgi:hypothetical protein
MTGRPPFFLPTIGLVLLFAALGPAVGGAVFIPLAFMLEAPVEVAAVAHIGWIAALIGHAIALIPAFVVGILPAAATGFVYALWDAWAPRNLPRALAAAAIGGALADGLFLWLASLAAMVFGGHGAHAGGWFGDLFTGEFDATLQKALIGSGAVAGFACAMTANLLGLTTSGPPPTLASRA